MENKKLFYIRLGLFLIFALILPIVYISIRFQLFNKTTSISIWGVICCLIIIGVLVCMVKFYLEGLKTKFSYIKQLLTGFIRVIVPIVILLLISYWIKTSASLYIGKIDTLIQTLVVILCSEIIAIIVNPLPKWAFENNVDGLVQIGDKIFSKIGGTK